MVCALPGASFVLQPFQDTSQDNVQIHWCSPKEEGIPTSMIPQLSTLFNSAFGGDVVRLHQYLSHSLLQVPQAQQPSNIPSMLLNASDGFDKLQAVMAIKPNFWSQECPRFCLFVLLDKNFDNEDRLRGLLHDTIRAHTFLAVYGHNVQDQPSWSANDEAILQDWKEHFSEENMLEC